MNPELAEGSVQGDKSALQNYSQGGASPGKSGLNKTAGSSKFKIKKDKGGSSDSDSNSSGSSSDSESSIDSDDSERTAKLRARRLKRRPS